MEQETPPTPITSTPPTPTRLHVKPTNTLQVVLTQAKDRLSASKKYPQKLGEQNTKSTAITPILETLGWDVTNFEEVCFEYKSRAGGNPVDYGLLWKGKPRLFVEAKGYGENIDDIRWVEQCLSYTTSAGVRWIVLTDGWTWKLYDAHNPSSAEGKLFKQTTISDQDSEDFFHLISKDTIVKNGLDNVAEVEKVNTLVLSALKEIFNSNKPPPRLINEIEKVLTSQSKPSDRLTREQIKEALMRCEAEFTFPQTSGDSTSETGTEITPEGETKIVHIPSNGVYSSSQDRTVQPPNPHRKAYYGVKLVDVIASGVLPVGTVLVPTESKYAHLTAHVEAGGINFNGVVYASPSTAGIAARHTIDPNAAGPNGWTFWAEQHTKKRLSTYRSEHQKLSDNISFSV